MNFLETEGAGNSPDSLQGFRPWGHRFLAITFSHLQSGPLVYPVHGTDINYPHSLASESLWLFYCSLLLGNHNGCGKNSYFPRGKKSQLQSHSNPSKHLTNQIQAWVFMKNHHIFIISGKCIQSRPEAVVSCSSRGMLASRTSVDSHTACLRGVHTQKCVALQAGSSFCPRCPLLVMLFFT